MKIIQKSLVDCRSSATGCLTGLNHKLIDSSFGLVAEVAYCANAVIPVIPCIHGETNNDSANANTFLV